MTVAQIKAAVRKRDGRCTDCGISNEDHIKRYGTSLDVHRLKPGSRYTFAGSVALCKTCHGPKPRSAWYERMQLLVDFHKRPELWKKFVEDAKKCDRPLTSQLFWVLKHYYALPNRPWDKELSSLPPDDAE